MVPRMFGSRSVAHIVHRIFMRRRRRSVLASAILEMLSGTGMKEGLDLGCGDGAISADLMRRSSGLTMQGLDRVVRSECQIPVQAYAGDKIPLADAAVDFVLAVDVLHHVEDPEDLLREAARVSRRAVILKDHRLDRIGARWILLVMDWVGNPPTLWKPARYLGRTEWAEIWRRLGLVATAERNDIGLYGPCLDWMFGRGLHFLVRLERTPVSAGESSLT